VERPNCVDRRFDSIQSAVRAVFSYEFMDRRTVPGLVDNYHLRIQSQKINRMEHTLASRRSIKCLDLIRRVFDDAKIKKSRLRLLKDDPQYISVYQRSGWRENLRGEASYEWEALRGSRQSANRPCST